METKKIKFEKVEQPKLAKHDSKCLDLAFAMDCTGSMGSYINSARDNIRKIVEEIVASEKSDVRLALVEYRDHPPQDRSFVTRAHDFTGSAKTMKGWLDNCSADGGGDCPEAVADALHDILKLSWRDEATKICVCISDAPPHGLGVGSDGFPEGCPAGIDPIAVIHQLAQKGITIYMVGCEPSICTYKEFFQAVAFITGGQYVPLTKAQLLTQVIIGGAQEEMSLEQFMSEIETEVQAEVAAGREVDEEDLARRWHANLLSQGVKTKQLQRNDKSLGGPPPSPMAQQMVNMKSMAEVRKTYKASMGEMTSRFMGSIPGGLSPPPPPGSMAPHLTGMAPPPPPPMGGFAPRPMPDMVPTRVGGIPPPPAAMGFPCGPPPPPPTQPMMAMPQQMQSVPAMGMAPSDMAPGDMASPTDRWSTVEGDVSYEQSARMVQKAIVRNFAKKKGT